MLPRTLWMQHSRGLACLPIEGARVCMCWALLPMRDKAMAPWREAGAHGAGEHQAPPVCEEAQIGLERENAGEKRASITPLPARAQPA